MFTPYVVEKIGWYVYALRNPLDGRVFYVGKGVGNRIFQHAQDALAVDGQEQLSQKLDLIRNIHAAGEQVQAFVVRHGLASEKLAYDVEAAVIDVLRLLDPDQENTLFSLKNAVLGHHHSTRGLAGVDVIASLYDAPPAPAITEPALLIKIPGLWTPTMTQEELYNATRRWWKVGDRRFKAKYAFSVNRGVIRQVYAIESWCQWKPEEADKPGIRWGFTGEIAPEMGHYLNTSVAHLYKKGDANPVRYANC
jgi:uncharacterized protein